MYELGSKMSLSGATSLAYRDVMRSLTAREARGSRSGSGATPPALRVFFLVANDLTSCSGRRVSPKKREDSPCLPPGPKQNNDRISVSFRSQERS